MGARIDDSAKKLSNNLKLNADDSMKHLSLTSRLCWSKNVNEERDAPDQILLGCAHPFYCVLIGLASWLEYHLGTGEDTETEFLFGIDGLDDADAIKRRASILMKAVLDDESFDLVIETDTLKGTHSLRKLAGTRAKKCGCFKDEIDYRFRWKCKRQQDTYVATTVPYPDAKVAAALCKDGAIHYHLKEESGLTDSWICDYVSPNITQVYGPAMGAVLGRALLWRIFDEKQSSVLFA